MGPSTPSFIVIMEDIRAKSEIDEGLAKKMSLR